jgi:hypothetical protein
MRAKIDLNRDTSQAIRFSAESFTDSILLFRCQQPVAKFEKANLKSAHTSESRKSTLRNSQDQTI